jgi:hypothetical protein
MKNAVMDVGGSPVWLEKARVVLSAAESGQHKSGKQDDG